MNESIKNCHISRADLCFAHGCLTAMINVAAKGWGCGFGGRVLNTPLGAKWIADLMIVLQVQDWSKLAGLPVRVRFEDQTINAIGHYSDDRWFFADGSAIGYDLDASELIENK